MKVFISSVISGMEAARDGAARAIRALGYEVIRAEDFGAMPDSPQSACLAGVRAADAVVLLIGARYGAPQASGLSATHEEYNEARERCPVLVMVQAGVDHEQSQRQFLDEVQDWAQGHYTHRFDDPDNLRDAVSGALHNLELARATGAVDPEEMLQRALALLPEEDHGQVVGTRIALALAGGPLQTVLRPSRLEAKDLRDRVHQMALFGDAAVLATQQGTDTGIDDDSLVLVQPDRSLAISETGSIRLVTAIPDPETGLPVIIEEDVRDIISRFLRFGSGVLAEIDPVNRMSHVAIAAKLLGADHQAWRTRAETRGVRAVSSWPACSARSARRSIYRRRTGRARRCALAQRTL